MNEPPTNETPQVAEEAAQLRTRRVLAITLLIVVLVALGYATVLFVAGNALQDAPFAQQILGVRERFRQLISVEPPRQLPPVGEPEEGIQVSPSPVQASPRPVLSPSVIPPSPDAPSLVTFTIEYENTTGVQLTGVRITNDLPSGTRLVNGSANPPASFDGRRLVWNLGTVAPEAKGAVSFQVSTLRKGRISNTAIMSSNEAPDSTITSSAVIS